jgi:hypothetical protein
VRTSIPVTILTAASGCGGADTPHWAHDTLTITVVGEDVVVRQAWDLYRERWSRRLAERHRLCTQTFTLAAEERSADCEGCILAWDVLPEPAFADCDPLVDPTLVATRSIGVADDDAGLRTYIDVGYGWELHSGPVVGEWTGEGVFPSSFVWELAEGTTPVSSFERPASALRERAP